jgi:hypothetical protein
VQFDPIKPTLKAPGSMLSKLTYDGPISNFDLNFYLRRYTKGKDGKGAQFRRRVSPGRGLNWSTFRRNLSRL